MPELDAVIMAAGRSLRMGCNKLLLPLNGTSIIEQMLTRFPYQLFDQVIVVYSNDTIAALAGEYPVTAVHNPEPEAGKSATIRSGLAHSEAHRGVMFFVADQPLLRPTTISRLVDRFFTHPDRIIVPVAGGARRNPVIFPPDLRNELNKLEGNNGGRLLLEKHNDRVDETEFGSLQEFTDIDTISDYRALVG